jgi:hypothetical protein
LAVRSSIFRLSECQVTLPVLTILNIPVGVPLQACTLSKVAVYSVPGVGVVVAVAAVA